MTIGMVLLALNILTKRKGYGADGSKQWWCHMDHTTTRRLHVTEYCDAVAHTPKLSSQWKVQQSRKQWQQEFGCVSQLQGGATDNARLRESQKAAEQ